MQIGKEEMKLRLLPDDMTGYVENSKESTTMQRDVSGGNMGKELRL